MSTDLAHRDHRATTRLAALLADRGGQINGTGVWLPCRHCNAERGYHVEPDGRARVHVRIEACTCADATRLNGTREFVSNLITRCPVYLDAMKQPGDVVDETLAALVARNDPPTLFVRGARLVRLTADENHRPRLDTVDNDVARAMVLDDVVYVRTKIKPATKDKPEKEETRFVEPPSYVAPSIRGRGEWPGIPALEAIVGIPVLRADGTIHDQPGYDPGSRMIYAPAPGLEVPAIPDKPTRAQRDHALEQLLDVLCDFPFVGDPDRAHALALILTPFIRPLLDVAPLILISAPKPGTGKGLLVGVATTIATGGAIAALQLPQEEAELRKTITATLHGGASFIHFDDVTKLRGTALTTALTTPTWGDRKLGETTRLEIPQRATWIASGNNVEIGGDLVRRIVRIKLDAHVARPHERTGWRHPHLHRHVRDHRGDLVAAALTLCRAWIHAGRPTANVPVLGTFEQWAETIGGILHHAGVPGFLGNVRETWTEAAVEENAWEAFLTHVHEATGGKVFLGRELLGGLDQGLDWPAIEESLPDEIAAAYEATSVKSLGKALAAKAGTMYGDHGLHLVDCGKDRKGSTRWCVRTAKEATS